MPKIESVEKLDGEVRFHLTGVTYAQIEELLRKKCQGSEQVRVFYWQEHRVSVFQPGAEVLVDINSTQAEFQEILEGWLKELG